MSHPTRWKPGQSGNPAGRPKGSAKVAKLIRDKTNDLEEAVDFALALARNTNYPIDQRFDAWKWLVDRGIGKAAAIVEVKTEHTEISADITIDMSVFTDEDLETFTRMLARAQGRELGSGIIDVEGGEE
jgi:hypothetical protein